MPTVAPHKIWCLLCRWLISHTSLFVAWLFNMAYSLALVYLATWTVVSVAPQAAGAGVAEVTAYLNGCSLPKVGRCALRDFTPRVWGFGSAQLGAAKRPAHLQLYMTCG